MTCVLFLLIYTCEGSHLTYNATYGISSFVELLGGSGRVKVSAMDFQNVNPLNVRLNMISGNLLITTEDEKPYPIYWRIFSVLTWLLQLILMMLLIPGCFLVPKEKALKDGTVCIVITMEVIFIFLRIHTRKKLMRRLIRELNSILSSKDETMRDIVTTTLKTMELPFKFYLSAGVMSIILWSSTPLTLIFKRSVFFYVDYRMPVAYMKEPLSVCSFIIGSFIVMITSVNIFTKKVSVDSYMIHLVLLVTSQYRYIELKLSMLFKNEDNWNDQKISLGMKNRAEVQIKALCHHHNIVVHIILMLKDLLSLNFSLLYVNYVLRFCFIGIMVVAIPSTTFWEGFLIIMYGTGAIVQLYIFCSCVQQLLDASVEITNKAFHEKWYCYGASVKRTFISMIMANNLECKLSLFTKFNMSLPSFMSILNQSYSIALLLLKTN